MDLHRPKAIAIPLETWIAQRDGIMERYTRRNLFKGVHSPNVTDRVKHRLSILVLHLRRALTALIQGQ